MNLLTVPSPTPGSSFAERYNVISHLGSGGMGEVYLAEDTMLENMVVAIKVLKASASSQSQEIARFLKEAQFSKTMTHKNIVRTYDASRFGETIYLVMEYLEGLTLKDCFNENDPLNIFQAVPVLMDVTDALDYMHGFKIIHRDIKPANIMLSKEGKAKVMDFGVARSAQSDLTSQNEIVGSAAYLAPEVWTGDETTAKVDIYALGVTAYEILTGRLPFQAGTPAEMMYKHLQEVAAPPKQLVDSIPEWLSNLILEMLAKDPSARPKSARSIRTRLKRGLAAVIAEQNEAVEKSTPARTSAGNLFSKKISGDLLGGFSDQVNDSIFGTTSIPAIEVDSQIDLASNEAKTTAAPQPKYLLRLVNIFLVAIVFLALTLTALNYILVPYLGYVARQKPNLLMLWFVLLATATALAVSLAPAFVLLKLEFSNSKIGPAIKNIIKLLTTLTASCYVVVSAGKALIHTINTQSTNILNSFRGAVDSLNFAWQKIIDLIFLSPLGVFFDFKTLNEYTVIVSKSEPDLLAATIHVLIYFLMIRYVFRELDAKVPTLKSATTPVVLLLIFYFALDLLVHFFLPQLRLEQQSISVLGPLANNALDVKISQYVLITAPFKWLALLVLLKSAKRYT